MSTPVLRATKPGARPFNASDEMLKSFEEKLAALQLEEEITPKTPSSFSVKLCKALGLGWAMLLVIFFFAASIHPAHAISVKRNSVITGDTIKLKDLFYGIEHNAERILGAAPIPGEEMVLNARTLMRVAIALNLDWRPSSTADYVVITRAATHIDRSMIEDLLHKKIAAEGFEGKFKLVVPNIDAELVLPPDQPATAEITHIDLRNSNNYFEATIVAPSKEMPLKTARVSGKIERMINIPVLNKNLRNGDIIGKRDIDTIEIEAQSVKHDVFLDAADLIGMTPRRMVAAHKPVQLNTLESPRMVRRGDMVTMTLQSGPLTLTAKAKALQDGAKGDVIRVVNMASNRTIEAEVQAEREVIVNSY